MKVLATSPASRDDVAAAAGLDAGSIGLLPIPVDIDVFRPADDETWEAALARPILVFVGRADDPRKNIPALFDAFARVRAEFPEAQLRLVGRPSLGPLPPGVEAAGEVSDVAGELQRAALFVLPSRQEGFGIVAAEAMACGLPVVTTPSGGPEDLVRRSGGGVVAADVGAAAISLLRNPDQLRTMRRNARDHVAREHSPATFRERLSAVLSAVQR